MGQGRAADVGPVQHGVPPDPAIDTSGSDNDEASGDRPATDAPAHSCAGHWLGWCESRSERPGGHREPRFHGPARSRLERRPSDLADQYRHNVVAVDLRA